MFCLNFNVIYHSEFAILFFSSPALFKNSDQYFFFYWIEYRQVYTMLVNSVLTFHQDYVFVCGWSIIYNPVVEIL